MDVWVGEKKLDIMQDRSGRKSMAASTAVTPAPGRETRHSVAPPRTAAPSRAATRAAQTRAEPTQPPAPAPPRTAVSQPRTAASQRPMGMNMTNQNTNQYLFSQKRRESFYSWSENKEVTSYEVYVSQASTYFSVQEYAKAVEHYSKVHQPIYANDGRTSNQISFSIILIFQVAHRELNA